MKTGNKKNLESQFLHFTSEMSLLIENSFDFFTALEILQKSSVDPALAKTIGSAITKIRNGQSVSQSLFSGEFSALPPFYQTVFSSAEKSGTFSRALENLKGYMLKRRAFENHIKKILIYPVLTTGFALLALSIILFHFLPSLNLVYRELDVDPPFFTGFLLSLSQKASLLFFPAAAAFFAAAVSFIRSPLKKIVLLGRIKPLSQTAKWFNGYYLSFHFSLLIDAGLDFLHALEVLSQGNLFKTMKNVLHDVRNGISPVISFEKNIPLPTVFYEALSLGLKGGKMKNTFHYLFESAQSKLEETAAFLSAVFEPLVIIMTAVFVGFIIFLGLYPLLT
ncbi:MAG: type II secretion system F family protein, partial [Candidatus Aureabacteria bacterium]|nr:type II secretion system F family protein [Candidatus Auribacterota bacterium]